MFAIAGVSGQTGSVVAEELIRRGKKVRVIVRDPEKGRLWKALGAEVAVGSVDDAEALTGALEGVEAVYLLIPPDMSATDPIGRARSLGEVYVRAIKGSGVGHVVFLSSIAAHHDSGTGPIRGTHAVQQRLLTSGANLTFLRPTYFLENWGSSLGPAAAEGVLPSFIPADHRFAQIATRDIGVAAADAFVNPARGVRILELAGPEEYSPNDIAGVVGSILGREVRVAVAPLDAVVPAFTSFGVSPEVAELFREMYEGLISGRVEWDGKGERRRGTTTPEEVLRSMIQR